MVSAEGWTQLVVRHSGKGPGGSHVVCLVGELDVATRRLVSEIADHNSCASDIVLDLSELEFLDRGGFGAIVQLAKGFALQGRSLWLTGQVGEPARLLGLLGLPTGVSTQSGIVTGANQRRQRALNLTASNE
jgi:anti-anti-sigma factor